MATSCVFDFDVFMGFCKNPMDPFAVCSTPPVMSPVSMESEFWYTDGAAVNDDELTQPTSDMYCWEIMPSDDDIDAQSKNSPPHTPFISQRNIRPFVCIIKNGVVVQRGLRDAAYTSSTCTSLSQDHL